MATENIPSRLHCVAEGNVLAGANEILDDDKGKKQTVINQENDQRLETLETAVGTGGSVDSRIESAKTEIVGGASSDCNTLGKAEALISTNANDIAALQEAYAALTQNDVVVVAPADTWPVATPAQNIIYRVVDRTNTPPQYYADYMWNGTALVEMAQYNNAIDARPKKASQNLVTSGGVFDNMGALDVSELNATENPHTLAKYVDLSAALAAVPTDYQKGGMSIKFVQSSDNKYVQYRLMSDTFNTTPANWQGVDDIPTAGSDNLVKSGGVQNDLMDNLLLLSDEISFSNADYFIKPDGTFGSEDQYSHGVKKVNAGEVYILRSVSVDFPSHGLYVAFATSNSSSAGGAIPILNGTEVMYVPVGTSQKFIIPEGCNYLIFNQAPIVTKLYKYLDFLDKKIDKPILYNDNNIVIFSEGGNVKDSGIAIDEVDKNRTKIPIVQSGKYIINNTIDITTYETTDSTVWGYVVVDVTAGDKFYLDVAGGNTPRAYAFTNKGDCIIKYCDSGRFTGTIIAPSDGKIIINNNFVTLPEPTIYKLNENDGRIGDYNIGVIATKNKRAGDSVDLTPVLDYNTRRKWNYTILDCQAGDVFNIIGKCSDSGYATLLCFVDSANKYIGGTFTSQQFKNKTVKCPVGTVKMIVQFNNSEDFSIYKLDSYQEKIYVNREDYIEQTGDIFTGDVYKVKSVSGMIWSQWREPLAETYSKEDVNLTAAGYVDIDGLVGVAVLDDAGIYTCCPFYNSVVGDDHNNSAVRFVDNKLYVGCGSGHTDYKNGNMYMAVFDNPFNLTEYILHVMPVATTPDDKTTYCQMFYYDGYWYMFYRGADTGWDCLKTADFTNLTIITSHAGFYCCYHKVKGYSNLIRIVAADNGAFRNNFIKEAILDLNDMKVKDDNLYVLGDYADLDAIFNSVQSFVPPILGDYDRIRLFDTSVPETELNNIIIGFARYQLGENDGKYYMYLNGSVVEVDDCGEPFYPTSQYLPGIATCEFNTNFIVYAKKIGDVSYLCSAYITENAIKKEVIDSSKVLLIRPYFIKNDMNRIFYLRGIYPSSSYLEANTTLLKKEVNYPI